MLAGVAGWAGFALAAEVARLGGYPMAGQPPEHFKVPSRRTTRRRAPEAPPTTNERPTPIPVVPQIGLADILRVGDQVDLGDGLTPTQRAENTLRLFLGETLYRQLETNHFLDVSSVRYAGEQRVYRLRRDPTRRSDRRVRVFEHGSYQRDYCIVRGQDVPEADHYLSVFLGLLSDELSTLSVVGQYNIFECYSDVVSPVPPFERETLPSGWQQRQA